MGFLGFSFGTEAENHLMEHTSNQPERVHLVVVLGCWERQQFAQEIRQPRLVLRKVDLAH